MYIHIFKMYFIQIVVFTLLCLDYAKIFGVLFVCFFLYI